MTEKHAVILGGGMIGATMAADLARTPGFRVTVLDARETVVQRLAALPNVQAKCSDLSSTQNVKNAIANADIVLGALSSVLGMQTLRTVLEAKKPYCDISFMEENAWELDSYAKELGAVAVVDCGVAPGTSNLLCGYGESLLDESEQVEIYVGGLPHVRSWPFEYKAGFSPHDVLEEYTRPARLVEHGKVVVKEALSEPELMDFPGIGTLEAFNTDGLRSLAYTLKAPFMKEKTLRYPGHIELMRVFRATGLFSKEVIDVKGAKVRPLDVTAALMFPKWTFEDREADLTVMRIVVAGKKDGKRVRHTWDLLDHYDPASNTRSMSRTTGYAATSMAVLMARGVVTQPGVHPPEVLAKHPGVVEAFLKELTQRGVQLTHRVDEG